MAKKDLFEGMTRKSGTKTRKAAAGTETSNRVRGKVGSSRVGSSVVRRRSVESKATSTETTVNRRQSVKGESTEDEARKVLARKGVRKRSAADVAVLSEEMAAAEEAPSTEVLAETVEESGDAVAAEAVEVAPQAGDSAEVAEPADESSVAAEQVTETPSDAVEKVAEPQAADDASTGDAKATEVVKPAQKSSLPGLGSAVVAPPPGYDPTNPLAYQKKQEQAARTSPEGAGASEAGGAAGRGRRRVEHNVRPDGRGGRRGRQKPDPFGRSYGRRRPRKRNSGPKVASPSPKAQKRKVRVDNVISVGMLSKELGVKAPVVIHQLMDLTGEMMTITQMLDVDTATLIAAEFEYEVENVGFLEENYLQAVSEQEEEGHLAPRPPIVAVMGHVDHGKTTLLDAVRDARVAQGEAGGITQHIGAYQIEYEGKLVTFLDTPGHQAFTAMRAQGAEVTDVVILVVAVDDGVQPQTVEAIAHAKAAGVPIVVAINKMDKPDANADGIKTQLSEHEIISEEWGGDTMFIPISALKREGIEKLFEAVLLQAELLELSANADRHAEGVVIEAKMERGRGAVATVLIERGTLHRGDHVVVGCAFGKVRAIVDHRGKRVKLASPAMPVSVDGLSVLPEVGDSLAVVVSEKNARKLAENRERMKREELMSKARRKTAEDLFAEAQAVEFEELRLIIKTDVQGTLQALRGAIESIEVPGAEVRILLASVGDINESDVHLAATNGAVLVGFNVKVDARATRAAADQGVNPELYTVIYEVLDRVSRQLKGLLPPVYELVRQGSAEVRVLYKISSVGTIAGSYVVDGKLARNNHAKVLRAEECIWEGKVSGLKRFKDDTREVAAGYECGISLDGFNDIAEGDVVECYSSELVVED